MSEQDKAILTCTDRRQNGSCGCIQRYILHKTEVLNPAFVKTEVDFEPRSRLVNIKRISDDAYQLKTERNPSKCRQKLSQNLIFVDNFSIVTLLIGNDCYEEL